MPILKSIMIDQAPISPVIMKLFMPRNCKFVPANCAAQVSARKLEKATCWIVISKSTDKVKLYE